MSDTGWNALLDQTLDAVRERGLYRCRRLVEPIDAVRVRIDGQVIVNFASNNYLGLTHHTRVIEAATGAMTRFGAGSGAAALISGYTPAHASAELSLAAWKGTGAAVLFPSGYQANLAAIQTLSAVGGGGGGVRFLIDRLCHASLIDAIRGSGKPFRVFAHNQMAKLERLLADAPAGQTQVVVTEAIFSMDGDAAELKSLVALKRRYAFQLVLDEAHSTGIYGERGQGLAAELGFAAEVDVSIVTLSKALGGTGGAVCGSASFCEAVVNFGRAGIYTTSLPAAFAAAAEAAMGVVIAEPARRRRVRELAARVRSALGYKGDSPIVPVQLGAEDAAVGMAERMLADGLLVVAIRPPTVPRGTSRLRITLSSEHSDGEVERLIASLARAGLAHQANGREAS